jgi:putative transcriptional regulator
VVLVKNTELFAENDAEWLLLARKKMGLKQDELAKLVNYSHVTLSQIENSVFPLSETLKTKVVQLLKERNIIE